MTSRDDIRARLYQAAIELLDDEQLWRNLHLPDKADKKIAKLEYEKLLTNLHRFTEEHRTGKFYKFPEGLFEGQWGGCIQGDKPTQDEIIRLQRSDGKTTDVIIVEVVEQRASGWVFTFDKLDLSDVSHVGDVYDDDFDNWDPDDGPPF